MRVWTSWMLISAGALALAACGDEGGGAVEATTCTPALGGGDGAPVTYLAASCWTVKVDHFTTTVTDPTGTGAYQAWGSGTAGAAAGAGTAHENINGKHIKDFFGQRRTMLFGGVKLTMSSLPDQGIQSLTLYDGQTGYRLATATNTLVSMTSDSAATAALDASEADGETGQVSVNAGQVMRFENLYQQDEDADGAPLDKVDAPLLLADTGGAAAPGQVNDYYPPAP